MMPLQYSSKVTLSPFTSSKTQKPGCGLGLGLPHKGGCAFVFLRKLSVKMTPASAAMFLSVVKTDGKVIFTIQSLMTQSLGCFPPISPARNACLIFDSSHWLVIHKAIDELFMKRESKSPFQLSSIRGQLPVDEKDARSSPPQHSWLKMSKASRCEEISDADGFAFVWPWSVSAVVTKGDRAFALRAPTLWNSPPVELRHTLLKTFLFVQPWASVWSCLSVLFEFSSNWL